MSPNELTRSTKIDPEFLSCETYALLMLSAFNCVIVVYLVGEAVQVSHPLVVSVVQNI